LGLFFFFFICEEPEVFEASRFMLFPWSFLISEENINNSFCFGVAVVFFSGASWYRSSRCSKSVATCEIFQEASGCLFATVPSG